LDFEITMAAFLVPLPATTSGSAPENKQLISNLGHALVGIGRIGGKRCSHMGCVLQWNKEEQTWECPCHGSRFSADGKVLDNPACDGLKKKHKK
jgi:nitrite reductase/ring-hydroxylating ferredoxin subunit